MVADEEHVENLDLVCAEVLDENPKWVSMYLQGKGGLMGTFIGMTIRKLAAPDGRLRVVVNPKDINVIMVRLLKERA